MVTIKISGMKDVKLTPQEFNELVHCAKTMVSWDVGGTYGNGEYIDDKVGFNRIKRVIKKLNY